MIMITIIDAGSACRVCEAETHATATATVKALAVAVTVAAAVSCGIINAATWPND